LGLSCPEDLFDWEFFQSNPAPFFQFARKLYFPLADNQKVQPSDSHKLLRLLQDRKQLLRVYSQNIDGLEEQAGVERKRVVYAHGSLQWATCLTCKRKVPAADLETSILEGIIPCCRALLAPRSPTKRSVSSGSCTSAGGTPQPVTRREPSARQLERSCAVGDERSDSDRSQRRSAAIPSVPANTCGGVLKPNVTFFGQVLPDQVSRSLEADLRKVDALIVIGTSLSVAPISKVIGFLPPHIPRILINRTIVHPAASTLRKECNETDEGEKEGADFRENYVFDAYLLGNCDDVTRALVKQLLATDDEAAHAAAQNLAHIGRLLSEVREERQGQESEDNTNREEVLYRAEAWETAKVPAERVFLFPGAQPQTGSSSSSEETSAPIVQLQEVCHCNTCDKRIRRGSIHKCLHCFDYDLCSVCFPKFAPTHYDGQHQFGIEKVLSVTSRK
jgi:NAD-dependent SIR2 family protein deacetylase